VSAPVFVVPAASALAVGVTVTVDGDEGRHGAAVRRLRAGEGVELVDGAGRRAAGVVVAVAKATFNVAVTAVATEPPPAPRLTVVQAVLKGAAAEDAVTTLTEVGVDAVVPWTASRSVVRWTPDRAAHGVRRWRAAAREAAKQSRRAWVPDVPEPMPTAAVVRLLADATCGLVLDEAAEADLASVGVPEDGTIVLVVGPEGGITPEELAAFEAAGARAVRLGPTVLRGATAGTVAAGVVLAGSPRWRRPGGDDDGSLTG
jgi:16S rRNA (uracil1498-N3)-methyltransferase